jgi:hypothetical protein
MTQGSARIFAAFAAGVIFGFGLCLSGMLDPARVRGFLDIAGHFDPSLAFVLAGAVTVSRAGYLISRRLRHPLFDSIQSPHSRLDSCRPTSSSRRCLPVSSSMTSGRKGASWMQNGILMRTPMRSRWTFNPSLHSAICRARRRTARICFRPP